MDFLKNLDKDFQKALIIQLRNLWTHTSTAIEGNTLTLEETAFVLEEGLTVSGKPLKDHEEVVGHARAIDLLYGLLDQRTPLNEEALFNLHKAVQIHVIIEIYKPVGGWKKSLIQLSGWLMKSRWFLNMQHPKTCRHLWNNGLSCIMSLWHLLNPETKKRRCRPMFHFMFPLSASIPFLTETAEWQD